LPNYYFLMDASRLMESGRDSKAQIRRIDAVKGSLWQPPRLIRGDKFEQNQEIERELSWSELFFDLIFVSCIAKLGDEWRGGEFSTFEYGVYFFIVWGFWLQSCHYATRFYSDDLSNKAYFLLYQAGIIGMAINIEGGIKGDNTVRFCAFAAYINCLEVMMQMRVYLYFNGEAGHSARAAYWGKYHGFHALAKAVIWIATMFISPQRRLTMFIVSVALNYLRTYHVVIYFLLPSWRRIFQIPYLPMHIEHFSERLGGLVIIFLGECIDVIAKSPASASVSLYFYVFGCFFIIYTLKLLYFDVNIVEVHHHALRVRWWRGLIFVLSHPFLGLFIVLAGDASAAVVYEKAGQKEENDKLTAEQWFNRVVFYTGLAVIMCAIIQFCHKHIYKVQYKQVFRVLELVQVISQLTLGLAITGMSFVPELSNIDGRMYIMLGVMILLVILNYIDEVLENQYGEEVTTGMESRVTDAFDIEQVLKCLNSVIADSESFEAHAESTKYLVVQTKQGDPDSKLVRVVKGENGKWFNDGAYNKGYKHFMKLRGISLREFEEPDPAGYERYEQVLEILANNGIKASARLKRDLFAVSRMCEKTALAAAKSRKRWSPVFKESKDEKSQLLQDRASSDEWPLKTSID